MPAILNWFGDRAKAAVMQEVGARMDAAGKGIVTRAKELVPVDTGKLQASIGYVYSTSTMTLQIHADMPYAEVVEFGSSRMSARPYLRPALAEAGAAFGSTVSTAQLQFGGPGH